MSACVATLDYLSNEAAEQGGMMMGLAGRGRIREGAVLIVLAVWIVIAGRAEPGAAATQQAGTIDRAMASCRQDRVEGDIDLLLIGSSTITGWPVECSFPARTAVKRGLSGATIGDIESNLDDLLGRMTPRQILLYAGENDIARGDDAEQVSRALLALIADIRGQRPDADILVLSIKPAPGRSAYWPRAQAVNAMLRSNAAQGGYRLIDFASALLGPDRPEPRYYRADGIHLTPEGYARVDRVIAPHLTGAARDDAPTGERGAPPPPGCERAGP